jgi:hypothetical protein
VESTPWRLKAEIALLVRLGREADLFHSLSEKGYVRLPEGAPAAVVPVWSRTFEDLPAPRILELTARYDRPQIALRTLSDERVMDRLKSEPFPPHSVRTDLLLMAQQREMRLLKASGVISDVDC